MINIQSVCRQWWLAAVVVFVLATALFVWVVRDYQPDAPASTELVRVGTQCSFGFRMVICQPVYATPEEAS